MFCDERVSAVDVSTQSLILNPLMQLQNELSLSYLFTAYDLLVVRHTLGRAAVMYRGVVAEEGIAEEIFSYPVHPYIYRGYMARDPGAGSNVARQTLSHHS
ncbi:hypothetical protein OAH86_07510 [Planktomarina temperata]|nr:hypothetical protein [Planktomarina temperata]